MCKRGLSKLGFIEGQVSLLTQSFLKAHRVVHKPKQYQEYRQSLNVLEVNRVLDSDKLNKIEAFNKKRNKAIHGLFKGMARRDWDGQNKKVVELGRPIIDYLDKRYIPKHNHNLVPTNTNEAHQIFCIKNDL